MAAGCGGCPAGAAAVDGPGDLGPRPGGHDLSAGGDVMDQVAASAWQAATGKPAESKREAYHLRDTIWQPPVALGVTTRTHPNAIRRCRVYT